MYDELPNVNKRVLVIAGTLDAATSIQDDLMMVNQIPGSLLQYADAGHAAMLRHAVTSVAVISAFLDGVHCNDKLCRTHK